MYTHSCSFDFVLMFLFVTISIIICGERERENEREREREREKERERETERIIHGLPMIKERCCLEFRKYDTSYFSNEYGHVFCGID